MSEFNFSIGRFVEAFVNWLNQNYSAPFEIFSAIVERTVGFFEIILLYPHPFVIVAIFGLIAWRIIGKRGAVIIVTGFLFCWAMNLWKETMITTALVGVSTFVALVIAIPFGILSALNRVVNVITRPLMDIMQTMPPWVYLIPAVILFSLGRAPAVVATAIFAIPPPLRLTNLGIREVPYEQVEAGKAFGADPGQILLKIQLPAALPTIMAGVNQCIMMALAMAVLAGLIGAGGLGSEVVRGLTRMMIGVGVRAGLAIVILAIILDRISQGMIELFKKGPKEK